MFKKLFDRLTGKTGKSRASTLRATDPELWEAELLERVKEMSGDDPIIGAKVGGKELVQRMIAAMKTERGVHLESILGALGSLAGYACQASVRAQARARGLDERALFYMEAKGTDGKVYFFGDELNKPLAEDPYSVWSLVAGAAQAAGCKEIPRPGEIFEHVVKTLGSPEFGLPRLPPEHPIHDTPLNYVEVFWPKIFPMISRFCPDPAHWPILLGLAIQDIMSQGKGVFDPLLALKIVMECAVPMSKIDLEAGAWYR
ncbi:MAG TPA: hypothetical protein VGO11_18970 [Chthoniobacteraceae bacterium]|jgi:hypothetical protein|nr:hypothetical protein [Chthoniobacteraceae bacterium]